jgi:hypothetical protein
MLQIWNHYASRQGSYEAFTLPVEAFSGSDITDYVPATYRWIYGGPGQVEDLPCGRHNVTLTLETVPPVSASVIGASLRLSLSLVAGGAAVFAAGVDESITLSLDAGGVSGGVQGISESITLGLEAGAAIGDADLSGITESITLSLVAGVGSVASAPGIDEAITLGLVTGAAEGEVPGPAIIGSFINSDATADTSHTLNAPSLQEGDLLIAVLMWRTTGSITAPSGWSLNGTYMSSMSLDQRLVVYTKTAGSSEPGSYTWSTASSLRNCGLIVSVRNGAIDTVTESYGNGNTATISTVSNRLNLTVFTWIYAATSGTESYSQSISSGSITEVTDSPKAQPRISGGYTTSAATVTSTHFATDLGFNPNHAGINIQIVGA